MYSALIVSVPAYLAKKEKIIVYTRKTEKTCMQNNCIEYKLYMNYLFCSQNCQDAIRVLVPRKLHGLFGFVPFFSVILFCSYLWSRVIKKKNDLIYCVFGCFFFVCALKSLIYCIRRNGSGEINAWINHVIGIRMHCWVFSWYFIVSDYILFLTVINSANMYVIVVKNGITMIFLFVFARFFFFINRCLHCVGDDW